ncbi:MAG: S4 domain-containing protein [Candidatus Micrarchaeaceae archaeon]
MARKGNRRHLKSLAAPEYLGIHRKEEKYVAKANAGRHVASKSVPILLLLKKIGIINTRKECKYVIKEKAIKVNGKVISDYKYPVGIGDIVSIKDTGNYVVTINTYGKVAFKKVDGEANTSIFKIIRKFRIRNGKLMVQYHNGIILELPQKYNANVDDSMVVEFPSMALKKLLKLENGSKCLVIDGIHVGIVGEIEEIKKGQMHTSKTAVIKSSEGSFETPVKNIMVIE